MGDIPTNVAVFGASGVLGSQIVRALLTGGTHKVKAITRSESIAKFPIEVDVIKGDITSTSFLRQSLTGQDAVIIALGLNAPSEIDERVVAAAAGAGVKYILPNEFVSQDSVRKHFPFGIHEKKNKVRDLIERLGKSKWIAIVNGTWYDYSLANGAYGIDILNRRAKIWSPGTVAANATTVKQVAQAVAALLRLDGDRLVRYANQCVYVTSFRISQLDILHSVQRVTNTEDSDWNITWEDPSESIRVGHELAREGSSEGFIKVVYAMQFVPNGGGDYEATTDTANKALGLEQEDLDTVTQLTIENM